MSLDFPDSPSIGQQFSAGAQTWVWNGTAWTGYRGGPVVQTGDTAPTSVAEGLIWFNTSNGRTYVYYDGAWIDMSTATAISTSIVDNSAGDALTVIQQGAGRALAVEGTVAVTGSLNATTLTQDGSAVSLASELTSHASDTTNIHGIADTSLLATKSYAESAASVAAASVVDSAPETLNTLNELAAALGDDPNFATSTATALGNRVRVDAAQSLSTEQKTQARSNIEALSSGTGAVGTANLAAGAVTNEKLANSSISINGSAVSLGGSVSIDALPSQAGQSGKFLTTNGTSASWAAVAGARGGGTDQVFYENDTTITTSYSITSGKNALTAGPVSIASGATVTVPSGSVWSIV